MTTVTEEDFYEDDEPVEKIRSAFSRGEKGTTQRATGDTAERDSGTPALSVTAWEEWDSHALVVEQGSFGSYGSSALVVPARSSAKFVPA